MDLKLALECGVELCLSLVGAWGGVEESLETNFGPYEECVSEKLQKRLESKMSPEMNLQVWGPNFIVNVMVFYLTKFYMSNQTHSRV